jgi:hypothetical protein
MSPSPFLEKITSTREGSSCGANACLIKRLQAEVLRLRRGTNQGMASIPYKVGEGGAGDVPLSAIDAVLTEETAPRSRHLQHGVFMGGELCGLRTPSISCISSLYASTFSLLCFGV